MFWKVTRTPTQKSIVLDKCYAELEGEDPASKRFTDISNNVVKLESIPVPADPDRLSKNTLWTLFVYAGLTVMVVVVEIFGHSLTSRALSSSPFKPKLL